jgi:ribulokinase
MGNYLLGIDYGTGGTKACIIDPTGTVLAYAFREYPIITLHESWSEHDPHRYWSAFCEMTQECVAQAGIPSAEIRGLAVSSALPSLVMIDRAGVPVNNAYNLMDKRAKEEVEWLRSEIGEERIFKISGNRLDDHPNFVKLMWERNNRPKDFQTIHKALTIEGYIAFRLTGEYSLVHSSAALYGVAYDLVKRSFDQDLLAKIGIDPEILPPLHECEDIIGEVHEKAAAETGLVAGTPVAAGQVDFNAACVASGVTEVGDIQSNLGTAGNFGIVHEDTDFLYEMIALGFTVNPKKNFITIPTTTTGGMAIRYIRDRFGDGEREAERLTGVDAYDLLNMEAAGIPPGSDRLVVLPFLMGERTPIWDVYARGLVFGLSLNHTKGHLVRATMEGVAYAMYDSFRIFEQSGKKMNFPIVMHEGGAKSALWRQIITDVFNVSTVLTKKRTGAPLGDAILAGVATGLFDDYSVAKEWAEYIDEMQPNPENHELYMRYFEVFKGVYEGVKTQYRALSRI